MPDSAYQDRLKIYATDVDEEALTDGRHGIYTASKVEPVPPDGSSGTSTGSSSATASNRSSGAA